MDVAATKSSYYIVAEKLLPMSAPNPIIAKVDAIAAKWEEENRSSWCLLSRLFLCFIQVARGLANERMPLQSRILNSRSQRT